MITASERMEFERELSVQANQARDQIAHDLSVRNKAILRLAARIAVDPTFGERTFEREAASYITDMPGFTALAWIGPDNLVTYAQPDASKRMIGVNVADIGPERLALVEQARAITGSTLSEPIVLDGTEARGFILATPVFSGDVYLGALWSVFSMDVWIENLYFGADITSLKLLGIKMLVDGVPAYISPTFKPDSVNKVATDTARVLGKDVALRVTPNDAYLQLTSSWNREFLTGLIFVLSIATWMAVVAFHTAQRSGRAVGRANERLLDANTQMQLEVEHRRRAELSAKRSSAAKSQFLSMMSHEIRTPMHAILGSTELLNDTRLTKTQSGHVKAIRKAGKAMMTMIADLFDFDAFENDGIALRPEPCNLADIFNEATELLQPSSQKKGLGLGCKTSPDLPEACLLDISGIRQIVMNLARNAIKFTPSGRVDIQADVITRNGNRFIQLCVQDSGVGIPEDKLATIFEAFQQAQGDTCRQFEGLGLGLSIVDHLVRAMGGDIHVRSAENEGSCFTVTLPLVEAANSPCEPERQKQQDLVRDAKAMRVLLAEDNVTNQMIVKGFLKGSGIHLDVAADGQQAVEQFRIGDYDAVLMDVSMPRCNGFQATQKIREVEASMTKDKCAIIGFTANCGAEDRAKCLQAGMDDVLAKPASKRELAEILLAWVADDGDHRSQSVA